MPNVFTQESSELIAGLIGDYASDYIWVELAGFWNLYERGTCPESIIEHSGSQPICAPSFDEALRVLGSIGKVVNWDNGNEDIDLPHAHYIGANMTRLMMQARTKEDGLAAAEGYLVGLIKRYKQYNAEAPSSHYPRSAPGIGM